MNRMTFQRKYVAMVERDTETPKLLNIGSCDDPLGFGDGALHVDIDDWSVKHKHFLQANAEHIPVPDQSYPMVMLGDILEHCVNWLDVVREAARVTQAVLVMTIFEEWRLPGPGQWIKEGQQRGDEECRALGFTDRQDYQVKNYPDRIGADDNEVPHLIHINQFTEEDMLKIIQLMAELQFVPIETMKAFECVHEGHDIYNWQFAFCRVGGIR
jgi:hypothetical protein